MSSIMKYELEVELKSPADAFWNTLKDINVIYPRLFSDICKSIEILEGDGRSAGTIRLITFFRDTYGVGKTEKSKIDYIDEEKKSVGYLSLEGQKMRFNKYFHELNTVKENKENGKVMVVWTCTYQKRFRSFPGPELMKDSMSDLFHKLDDYTLSNL